MASEIKPPGTAGIESFSLLGVVELATPKILVYMLSFVVIAILLVNHHALMREAPHATPALYWWNAHLLFWISLIPFSTTTLGTNPYEPSAVGFYGAILSVNGFAFMMLHRYVSSPASATVDRSPPGDCGQTAQADRNIGNDLQYQRVSRTFAEECPVLHLVFPRHRRSGALKSCLRILCGERTLHCYETKIFAHPGDLSLQVAEAHLSDLAAIRVARRLCRAGEFAEVWREDNCIYTERPKPLRLVWPVCSEKALG